MLEVIDFVVVSANRLREAASLYASLRSDAEKCRLEMRLLRVRLDALAELIQLETGVAPSVTEEFSGQEQR